MWWFHTFYCLYVEVVGCIGLQIAMGRNMRFNWVPSLSILQKEPLFSVEGGKMRMFVYFLWSWITQSGNLQTSESYLHFYHIDTTDKQLRSSSQDNLGLSLVSVIFSSSVDASLYNRTVTVYATIYHNFLDIYEFSTQECAHSNISLVRIEVGLFQIFRVMVRYAPGWFHQWYCCWCVPQPQEI